MQIKNGPDIIQLLDDLKLSSKPLKKRRTFSGATWDISEHLSALQIDPDARVRKCRMPCSRPSIGDDSEADMVEMEPTSQVMEGAGCDADDESEDSPEPSAAVHHSLHPEMRKIYKNLVIGKPRFPLLRQPKAESMALVPYVPPSEVIKRIFCGKKPNATAEGDNGYDGETDGEAIRVLRQQVLEFLATCDGAGQIAPDAQMDMDGVG
eukprot:EG_transcript_15812